VSSSQFRDAFDSTTWTTVDNHLVKSKASSSALLPSLSLRATCVCHDADT
jgi:hypothetical protein